MLLKTILCYGDSNTRGEVPGVPGRHPWGIRWPSVLQENFGNSVKVIEEGLGGRTTCYEDPLSPNRNGQQFLPVVLDSHSPLDLVIIMLGTNDLKIHFNLTSYSIAQGAAKLVEVCKTHQPAIPHILLVSPPHVRTTGNKEYSIPFEGAVSKSKDLAAHYRFFSDKLGCHFFDASEAAEASPLDGVHLDEEAHRKLGLKLFSESKKILAV